MITEQDLLAAIAECQGERDPNANTCIKLAAFYTIYNQLFGKAEQSQNIHTLSSERLPMYSTAPAQSVEKPTIQYNSDTDFAQAVHGMPVDDVISVFDELMTTLWALYPRMYRNVMQRFEQ